MMTRLLSIGFMAMLVTASFGCTRTQKVAAFETPADIPYQNLGAIQTSVPTYRFTAPGVIWTGVEVVTLTLAKTPTRGVHYKNVLKRKLARLAKRRYKADAVVDVVYWPDPESKSFPEGKIYGRGTMVKYKRFPTGLNR